MLKKPKIIFIIIIFLLAGGFIYLRISSAPKTPAGEKTAVVMRKSLTQTVSASGKVKAKDEAVLKFQTGGQLAWVGVKEGDRVEKWQALASLDQTQLKKNLEKSLRDYSKTRLAFDQDRNDTFQNSLITNSISRILEKNQNDLEKSVMDVELNDLALKYSTIISPLSGIVTGINIPVAGVNVSPLTDNIVVSDPKTMVFAADIDESDLKNVKEGLESEITLDAYPDAPVKGIINRLSFTSKLTSGGGNAYPAEINLPDNSDLKYKIGMNGDVKIMVKKFPSVLTVPSATLFEENSQSFVYVLNAKMEKIKKTVTPGIETDEDTEIKKGLKEGEKILIPSN